MLFGNQASEGKQPTPPTIGIPTDGGTGTSVLVPFTPSTYIGKGTITYTATSNPGSITSTSATSPITVTGLTTGTSYQFTIIGTTNYGVNSLASAASLPVTPVTPTAFDSIATVTTTAGQTSLTFSSIPSTYKSLQIRAVNKAASTSTNYVFAEITFNGDTANNYTQHRLYGDGSIRASDGAAASGGGRPTLYGYTSSTALTNMFGVSIVDILDYASTSKNKTVKILTGADSNGSGSSQIFLISSTWLNTSAINSITITQQSGFGGFAAGATFALYGVN